MKLFKKTSLNVAIIGAGYVGLVSAFDYLRRGHNVLVLDIDREKIKTLIAGQVPFYEKGLTFKGSKVQFVSDYEELRKFAPHVVIFAVGTPPCEIDGSSDLRPLKGAVIDASAACVDNAVLPIFMIKSTVPPGTSKSLQKDSKYVWASNPEFLREGSAVSDALNPDRIVIGVNPGTSKEHIDTLKALYNNSSKIVMTDIVSAELAKYASNAFLAMKVTYINQMADLSAKVGGNIDDIAKIMGMDERIGSKFLQPSPGFGGSCFPKDVRSLIRTARNERVPLSLVETLQESNEERKIQIANDLVDFFMLKTHNQSILVYGVTFKEGTDDMRGSAAMTILPILARYGAALAIVEPLSKFAKEEFDRIGLAAYFYSETDNISKIVSNLDNGIIIMNRSTKPDEFDRRFIAAVDKFGIPVADLRNVLDINNERVSEWKRLGNYYSLGR